VIARLAGVTLSVLLHAGLIALLLAWSSAIDWTRPLFVDLVERPASAGSPSARPAPSPRPPSRAGGARAVARPGPARAGRARGAVGAGSRPGPDGARGSRRPIAAVGSRPRARAVARASR
jgi:hypothetical protein